MLQRTTAIEIFAECPEGPFSYVNLVCSHITVFVDDYFRSEDVFIESFDPPVYHVGRQLLDAHGWPVK